MNILKTTYYRCFRMAQWIGLWNP